MKINIRILYLYLFSLVGLIILVVGSVQIVDLGLRTFVFKNADRYMSYPVGKPLTREEQIAQPSEEELRRYQENETRTQRERQMSNSLAMIFVGAPLYLYHWKTIQKDQEKTNI